jgi:hypothetical protein
VHQTEVLALLTSVAMPTITLDAAAFPKALCPSSDDSHAVACLRFDVMTAVRELDDGFRAGQLPRRRLVHGQPLADRLSLDTVATLLSHFSRARLQARHDCQGDP